MSNQSPTNNIQEILLVQKTTKWMINLGIPIIVGLLGYNQMTLDNLKDSDAKQREDIATLKEKVNNLEGAFGHSLNRQKVMLFPGNILFMIFGEAILPKEEHLDIPTNDNIQA